MASVVAYYFCQKREVQKGKIEISTKVEFKKKECLETYLEVICDCLDF